MTLISLTLKSIEQHDVWQIINPTIFKQSTSLATKRAMLYTTKTQPKWHHYRPNSHPQWNHYRPKSNQNASLQTKKPNKKLSLLQSWFPNIIFTFRSLLIAMCSLLSHKMTTSFKCCFAFASCDSCWWANNFSLVPNPCISLLLRNLKFNTLSSCDQV